MTNDSEPKAALIREVTALRARVGELEAAHRPARNPLERRRSGAARRSWSNGVCRDWSAVTDGEGRGRAGATTPAAAAGSPTDQA